MHAIVIGSGVVGAAVADALAQGGAAVTVLDMRAPGHGASQAAAGMLAPYSEALNHPELLTLASRSLSMFDAYVERLQRSARRPLEYARTGTLDIALDASGTAHLRTLEAALLSHGTSCTWLDADAIRAREPAVTPSAAGGLFIGVHGMIGAQAFVDALVDRARNSGATFEYPAEVANVESLADRAVVHTASQRYEADVVVIAAGSWSRRVRVANVAALPVRPVRGQLLHLRWRGAEPPRQIVWGPRCYTVPWTDGSLLVGATVEDAGFDEHVTVDGARSLTAAVIELLPAAAQATLETIRVGLRPVLPDQLPAIGPITRAPRVIMATGHYRNGVLLAPLTAHIVSRYILAGTIDPAFAVTSPDRFFGQPQART